ncbi:MAG: glycosyltransferase family 39 protein [Verrucomicrobia bacterium]|nr:glycosyltransferase family 39 protein [Verrucomicrobiota bacterium]
MLEPPAPARGTVAPPPQPAAPARAPARTGWLAVLVALAALLTYANSLGNYFLIDDFWHLDKAARTPWSQVLQPWEYSGEDFKAYWSNEQRLRGIRGEGFFRPVVTVIYKLAGALFGVQAWGYHLINILLHALASMAAFAIARLLFRRRWVAVAAGLFFATHPSHAETVQWVAANADAAMGCFFLTAFAAFGWWLRQRRPWQYAAALAAFALALGAKESAVMLPAVLLAFEFYRARRENLPRPGWRALAARHAALWALAAGYLAMHFRAFAGISAMNEGGQYMHSPFSPDFVPFVLFNLSYEMLHLLVPFPLFPIDPTEFIGEAGWWPVTLTGAAILGGIWWLDRRFVGRGRGASFFPLFAMLTLAPTFPILVAQRFLYVPSLGFCLMLGAVLERAAGARWFERRWAWRWPRLSNRGWVFAAVSAVVAGYAAASVFLNFMWGFPSNLVRRQIAAIQREVPAPARGSTLCLLNLWPPAFGMEFMLPLAYGDPTLDVQVLTVQPKILPLDSEEPPGPLVRFFHKCLPDHVGATTIHARWDGPASLRVNIEGGRFMRSLIEEIYPVAAAVQKTGAKVETARFTAEVARADAAGVQELAFRFRDGERPVVLDLRNEKVARVR